MKNDKSKNRRVAVESYGDQNENKIDSRRKNFSEIRQSELSRFSSFRLVFFLQSNRARARSDFHRRCRQSLEHHPRRLETDVNRFVLPRSGRHGVGNLQQNDRQRMGQPSVRRDFGFRLRNRRRRFLADRSGASRQR